MNKNVCLALVVLSIITTSCEKKLTESEPPELLGPAAASGRTNSQGAVSLALGSYMIEAEIMAAGNTPVPQMTVQAFLLEGRVVVTALDSLDRYYPAIRIVELQGLQKNALANSSQPVPIFIVIGVIALGATIIDIIMDVDVIKNNGYIEKICYGADLGDILTIATSGAGQIVRKSGILLSLSRTAAQKLGVSAKSVAMTGEALIGGTSVLSAVLSNTFHILDQDRMSICYYTPRGSGKNIPMLSIENVELRRDFQYKFTLTWGQHPADLDAHLWTPSIGGVSYHLYFANKGSLTSVPFAQLDVDDVASYGPENTTIKTLSAGTYRFAVHHFNGMGSLTSSGARLKVFNKEGLVGEYAVPTSTASFINWWWYVGDVNGLTGAFTFRNQILPNPPQGNMLNLLVK